MEKSVAQHIFEAAELDTRRYSGRSMHGRFCLGVIVPDMGKLLLAVAEFVDDENRTEVLEVLQNVATDSMGHEMIVYFPDVEYVGDDEGDEDAA